LGLEIPATRSPLVDAALPPGYEKDFLKGLRISTKELTLEPVPKRERAP
jgi:hypothetical protein